MPDYSSAPDSRTLPQHKVRAIYRLMVVLVLGFASGLPLALTGQAMQAWLTTDGIDVATIGFLSLVGLPYTFKFLWAPLMDRFEVPFLGRRRGWLVLMQLGVGGALWWISMMTPHESLKWFALLAVLVAFLSASQDIVIDAYRTDLLESKERGMGSSLNVLGYRLAMILSGGIAFIWADAQQGGGWTWPEIYRFMAWVMVGLAAFSAVALPQLTHIDKPYTNAKNDILGFLAVLGAVALGYVLTGGLGAHVGEGFRSSWCQGATCVGWASAISQILEHGVVAPLVQSVLTPVLAATSLIATLQTKWIDLAVLLVGIAVTLPLTYWAAKKARFETLLGGLSNYFQQPGAVAFLGFIVLYKLGDAFAGSLLTPFLMQGMAFTTAEIGVVNKLIGLWLTIAGALFGGLIMLRIGLWRALMLFGVFQMLSNLGFWWLSVNGQGALPGLMIPAFNWGFVKLAQATPVDGGLLLVISLENLSGGMGTAAFVALLMSLCNHKFTATQYALLSAFASVGRVWVGPLAGVLAESIGWPTFFIVSTLLAFPALWMLWTLRYSVKALESPLSQS